MTEEEHDHPASDPERKRPSIDVPPSVLNVLASKTGEAPRISLRHGDVEAVDSPPIDPSSSERDARAEGRGNYQVLGEIARGGMGVVMRGHDTDLCRDVAMKILNKELADRPEVIQRFVEEAQIGGQLQHPGIVPVYELGLMADERPYFTMKLVKGRTLATLLSERPDAAAEHRRLIDIFDSVCQTVAYAHSRGVIHRDLKPANIMVGAFGEVQVVDWGLAKVLARGNKADEKRAREARQEHTILETVRSDGSSEGSVSMVGSVIGTPEYMPPEQASGRVDRLDERSDVFALGAILCEILSGRPPYVGERGQVLSRAAQAELDPALERLESCDGDPELVKIAKQCLVAAPDARPRHAGVLAQSVQVHLETVEERAHKAQIEAAEARVRVHQERKARRLTLALAASVLGFGVLGGGGWIWRERQVREDAARVERGLEELRTQVVGLQAEGRFDDALQSARNALVLVDGRTAGDNQRARVERFVRQAEELAAQERERHEGEQRDDTLLARLGELRLESSLNLTGSQQVELDQAFEKAFQSWGVDVDADIERSLEQLRASAICEHLAPALDDWASVRRRAYGWSSFEAMTISALAADLDPEPLHIELREALMAEDEERLLAIAADPEAEQFPASTAGVLGNALKDLGRRSEAIALLERATGRYPENLRLRISAATAAKEVQNHEVALRHFSAAVALRPDMPALALEEGMALKATSRFPAAARAFRRVLAKDPDHIAALNGLGEIYFELRDNEQAIAFFERPIELGQSTIPANLMLNAARYRSGQIELEEFITRVDAMGGGSIHPMAKMRHLMSVLFLLIPVSGEPDIERAEALLDSMPDPMPEGFSEISLSLRARAQLMRDQPEQALATCFEMSRKLAPFVPPHRRASLAILRAQSLSRLGRREEAQDQILQAQRILEPLVFEAPEAWERNDVVLQLRQVEAELRDR